MNGEKILLVTGASSEIGRKLISNIESQYSYIWAHYNLSSGVVEKLEKEIGKKIIPLKADFSDSESLGRMIRTLTASDKKPNHIVHLSAPSITYEKIQKKRWGEYQQGIDISVRSIVEILNAVIPTMSKKKYGKIVFVLTSYLVGVAPKYQSSYITTKYALYGLMRCLAAELAGKGINVNAVSPEMIETRYLKDLPDVAVRVHADTNPLKRNMVIDDVIPTIAYLLSDGSDTVTGQNIGVTGGAELV